MNSPIIPTRIETTGQRGFTMLELMVVVAVIAILAGLAAPSFNKLILDQRIKTMAADLNASLARTRSEAVKRNTNVTLWPSTAGAWQNGWTIADPNNAGINIEAHSGYTGLAVTGPASVTYQSSGRIQGAAAPAFNIGAPAGSTFRCVTVDLSGHPYVKPAAC